MTALDVVREADIVCSPVTTPTERLQALGRLAGHVLELQRTYFRTRGREDLILSKEAEKQLRRAAFGAQR